MLPDFTAEENVVLPQLVAGTARGAAGVRARELLVSLGLEHRMSWFSSLADLPTRTPEEQEKVSRFQAEIVSYQHPDHDT